MLDGQEHLVKTGISRSLLGQAMACCAKGQGETANKRLGYIVGSAARLLEGAMDKEATQQWLTRAFHAFLDTEKGKKLAEKAKTGALDIDDVCGIHDSLVAADPRLRNPLGIPVLFDVINVAAAQDLVNALQERHLSRQHIPDSSLLTLPNNALIASRLIHDAEPLDTFLTKAFLPPDISLAQAKQSAARVESAAAGSGVRADELAEDHALLARINDPVNLRTGKQALVDTLRHNGLDGLFASLLVRLTLGEASDLGPDNMLVIPGEDARHKVISIDVTGFRYDREKDAPATSREPFRYGWGDVIQTPARALEALLHASVMSSRYARGLEGVHAMVIEAIREALDGQATPEVEMVKQWYAALDVDSATASLRSLGDQLKGMSDAGWMPDAALVNQVLQRNSSFLGNVIEKARK
ncbi:type III secretion system effector protein (plasmid) [Xanthomonas axonopodis pv. vasculorum]